jgi:hypothetical protein
MNKSSLLIISFGLIIIIICLFNFKYNINEKFIVTYKNVLKQSLPTTPAPNIISMPQILPPSTIVLLNTKKEIAPIDLDPDLVCDDNGKVCLVNFKFFYDNMSKYAYGTV